MSANRREFISQAVAALAATVSPAQAKPALDLHDVATLRKLLATSLLRTALAADTELFNRLANPHVWDVVQRSLCETPNLIMAGLGDEQLEKFVERFWNSKEDALKL